MKKERMIQRISAGILALMLTISVIPMELYIAAPNRGDRITHGTSSTVITKDMLNNTPPADYVIDDATQGKAKDGEYNKFFLEVIYFLLLLTLGNILKRLSMVKNKISSDVTRLVLTISFLIKL